jgi:hypothetical protein
MHYPNNIEDICYEMQHINQVLDEIKSNIPAYFQSYLDTEGGEAVAEDDVICLARVFGSSGHQNQSLKTTKTF